MKFPSKEHIEMFRKKYLAGTVVELISMEDTQAPPAGTLGMVWGVDGAGSILVCWRNGFSLSLIPEVDEFRIMKSANKKSSHQQ